MKFEWNSFCHFVERRKFYGVVMFVGLLYLYDSLCSTDLTLLQSPESCKDTMHSLLPPKEFNLSRQYHEIIGNFFAGVNNCTKIACLFIIDTVPLVHGKLETILSCSQMRFIVLNCLDFPQSFIFCFVKSRANCQVSPPPPPPPLPQTHLLN